MKFSINLAKSRLLHRQSVLHRLKWKFPVWSVSRYTWQRRKPVKLESSDNKSIKSLNSFIFFNCLHLDFISDYFAKLQELIQSKGDECIELSANISEIQAKKNEICQRLSQADGELFKLRAQERDTQYLLDSKDDNISELHEKLKMTRREVQKLKKFPFALNLTERNAEIQRLKEDLQDAEVFLAEKDGKIKTVQVEIGFHFLNNLVANISLPKRNF